MKLNKDKLRRETMAQTTQSVFYSIRVTDYFRVLEEMTDDTSYRDSARAVLKYSSLDNRYAFDFNSPTPPPICRDITIGEMMYAIERMLCPDTYPIKLSNCTNPCRLLIDTGMMLMEELMIKPMRHLQNLHEARLSTPKTNDSQSMV